MKRLEMLLAMTVVLMPACNAMLGVDVCGKQCDADADCGSGFTCRNAVCGGGDCASNPGAASSSSSSGTVSSSSSSSTSTSSSTSSSSSTGGTSCAAQPTGAPCGTGLVCNPSGVCVSSCFINGQLKSPGADPGNACRQCAPLQSTTQWTTSPANTPCNGTDVCSLAACNGSGACISADKCVNDATNRRCLQDGSCGCTQRSDCAAGTGCNLATHQCETCTTVGSCGSTCGDCHSLPLSLGEAAYYTCTSSTQSLSQACQVVACSSGTANCNADDGDQCEVNISSDPNNCSACGMQCSQGRSCTNNACGCQNDNNCPMNQQCNNNRCRCADNGDCANGYRCNNSNKTCVR
jgi:hypothetical protein